MPELDTLNRFAVGMGTSGHVQILGLVVISERMKAGGLTDDEALNLAAWIVAMVTTTNPSAAVKFEKLYSAILKT